MKTVLAIIVLCVVALSVTASQVYAERSTVEVPFDYTGHGCTFDQDSVVYTCRWEGSSETVTKQSLNDAGIVPEKQRAEESKEAHEEAIATKVEKEITPLQREIIKLQEKQADGKISSADLILLDLLVQLKDECQLGVEHGKLIQQYAKFEIPMNDPRTQFKAIDYGKNLMLGNIIKKIEECRGWDAYRVDVLGQRYLDIIEVGIDNQKYHQQMATDNGAYPTQQLTEQSFRDSLTQAEEYICKASFYDVQFKKERGCFNVPVEKYPAIVDNSLKNNPSMRAYTEYRSAGTVDLDTLKKSEVAKAHQQSLESFAIQHGIDVADLKNLVQGDKP